VAVLNGHIATHISSAQIKMTLGTLIISASPNEDLKSEVGPQMVANEGESVKKVGKGLG